MNSKTKNVLVAGVFAISSLMSLTGCSKYTVGEVIDVEEGTGPNGPVLEIEIVSESYQGLSEPPSYEVHVPTDSGCEVGDIYNPRMETCN